MTIQIRGQACKRLAAVLAIALIASLAARLTMRANLLRAADPTPQASRDVTELVLAQYNGITRTSDFGTAGAGVGFITGQWAMGDCYNNIAYLNGTSNSAVTLTLQNSSDGRTWADTQSIVAITNSAVFSRVVLYGFYTRIFATGIQTSVNPITGSVVCVLRNGL